MKAAGILTPAQVAWWEHKRASLDPRELKEQMNRLADRIVRMPQANPADHTEDVHETMYQPFEVLAVR